MKITFQPLTMKDLSYLHRWFQEPVIWQLYGRDQEWSLDKIIQKYQPRIIGEENIPSFIIEINNQPSGFIQYYCLQEHLPEGIGENYNRLFEKHSPNEIAGIDVFIATFLTDYRIIVVDPERNNLHAIRCYEKAGFKKTDFSSDKHHLLLTKKRQNRSHY